MQRAARRRAGTLAAVAVVGALASLAAGSDSRLGPDCAGPDLRLLPQYDAATPGGATPQDAAMALAGSSSVPPALGDDVQATLVEARPGSTMVELTSAGTVVGVARTAPHPAGGWLVDELWTCAEVAR